MIAIYSRDNRWRATLAETVDGIECRLWRFVKLIETRGVNVSALDPAALPDCFWAQVWQDVFEAPLHIALDRVHALIYPMTGADPWKS